MGTFGPAYDEQIDGHALSDQRNRILVLMSDANWRTLFEISQRIPYCPEASASAQLRHLRKPQFGGWIVDKRRREGYRVWEYRLRSPSELNLQ